MSAEVASVPCQDSLETRKVSDSAVRMSSSVEGSVMRNSVYSSGKELSAVGGGVVAVAGRTEVVVVCSIVSVAKSGILMAVVGSTVVVVVIRGVVVG